MRKATAITHQTISVDRPALDAWAIAADKLLDDIEEVARPEVLRKLWGSVSKGRDFQLQVRRGWLFDTEFVELIDYIPSEGCHHDGIRLEPRLLPDLIQQLVALQAFLSAASTVVGQNQGLLW